MKNPLRCPECNWKVKTIQEAPFDKKGWTVVRCSNCGADYLLNQWGLWVDENGKRIIHQQITRAPEKKKEPEKKEPKIKKSKPALDFE
jgi:NMD protein affecting ribosome stability and mRNA decay